MMSFFGIADPVTNLVLFILLWSVQSTGIAFMDAAIDGLVVQSFPLDGSLDW